MSRPHAGAASPAVQLLAQVRSTADEVARRAFELYERRCSVDGWDIDDLEGEPQLVQDHQPRCRP